MRDLLYTSSWMLAIEQQLLCGRFLMVQIPKYIITSHFVIGKKIVVIEDNAESLPLFPVKGTVQRDRSGRN
jgi:hypothetical protein